MNKLNKPGKNQDDEILNYLKNQTEKRNNDESLEYILNLTRLFKESVEFICEKLPGLDRENNLIRDCIILDSNYSIEFYFITV